MKLGKCVYDHVVFAQATLLCFVCVDLLPSSFDLPCVCSASQNGGALPFDL